MFLPDPSFFLVKPYWRVDLNLEPYLLGPGHMHAVVPTWVSGLLSTGHQVRWLLAVQSLWAGLVFLSQSGLLYLSIPQGE